jgi:hypothetical protein
MRTTSEGTMLGRLGTERWLWTGIACGLLGAPLAAQQLPKTDISWTAEHLPESVQDSRLLALPWPGHPLVAGERQTTFDLGWQSATADLGAARGLLAAAGVTWARSEHLGIGAFAFYDQLSISGGGTRDLVRPSLEPAIPLALPAFAELTNPRGDVRHWGLGGLIAWQDQKPGGRWRRTLLAGAYLERLEVSGFQFDYQLVSGSDAGARGALDWSASYSFVTPFAGIGWTRALGAAWTMSPRLIAGQPLPRRRLEGTFSGPGFSVHGSGSSPVVGDAYLGAGLAFEHLPTGLSLDLGSSLYYAGTEGVSHEGLNQAILVHLAWTR